MLIDLNLYKHHLPTIKGMLDTRRYTDPNELVSEMAIATHCHIIVCLYYTAHFVGLIPSLTKSLEINKDFYNIKEIVGWPLKLN